MKRQPKRYDVQSSVDGKQWRRRISYATQEKALQHRKLAIVYSSGEHWRVFDNETGGVVE